MDKKEDWEDIELYAPTALANEFFYAEVRAFQWMLISGKKRRYELKP